MLEEKKMTNSSGRLPREARGYSKTALVKGVETGVRTWSTRRGASWLAARNEAIIIRANDDRVFEDIHKQLED